MAMVAGIGMMVGAGFSAYGQYNAGKDQRALGEFNAGVSEQKARDALVRGDWSENRLREETRKLIGQQRVAFAASGVDITDADSTAANVFADTQALSELDAQTIRYNAQREAWGHRMDAENFRRGGQTAYEAGKMNAIGTLFQAGGSLLYGKYGSGAEKRQRNYSWSG